MPVLLMKWCNDCRSFKPRREFHRNKSQSDGCCRFCKTCTARRNQEFHVRLREDSTAHKDYYHAKKLRQHGLTVDEYATMLAAQGNKCAICKQPETHRIAGKPVSLAIDHCHTTGRVRRLLCFRCNTVLGLMRENPKLLRSAADYLEKHNGKHTPARRGDKCAA